MVVGFDIVKFKEWCYFSWGEKVVVWIKCFVLLINFVIDWGGDDGVVVVVKFVFKLCVSKF